MFWIFVFLNFKLNLVLFYWSVREFQSAISSTQFLFSLVIWQEQCSLVIIEHKLGDLIYALGSRGQEIWLNYPKFRTSQRPLLLKDGVEM